MNTVKTIGIIALAVAFVAALGVTGINIMAQQQDSPVSGNQDQSQEKEQDSQIQSSAEYIRSLKAKEAELNRREKELLQREQQIIVQEKDLADRIRQFDREREEFDEMKQAWTENQEVIAQAAQAERIRSIATSFKNVKSSNAAAQLIALFDQNKTTALLILNQIDSRTFGKIFDKIDSPDKAAQIYEALKDWNISVDEARQIVETEPGQ